MLELNFWTEGLNTVYGISANRCSPMTINTIGQAIHVHLRRSVNTFKTKSTISRYARLRVRMKFVPLIAVSLAGTIIAKPLPFEEFDEQSRQVGQSVGLSQG